MERPVSSRPFSLPMLLRWLAVLGMFAAGALLYDKLPAVMPTHWGFSGEADGFMSKPWGVWLLPLMSLAMLLLFPFFRRIDPKRENYEAFRETWDLLQLCIVVFFAYVYGMQLYLALHPLPSPYFVGKFVTFGIGVLFVILGNYMGKIRQNFFIGLRTPWSLSDPEVWNRSQRFGGWAFVLGGLAIIAESILWWHAEIVFFGIIVLIAFLPILYSYLIFRGMKTVRGLVLFTIVILAVIVAVLRLAGSEDEWICDDDQWVKHGNPSAAMPTAPCP